MTHLKKCGTRLSFSVSIMNSGSALGTHKKSPVSAKMPNRGTGETAKRSMKIEQQNRRNGEAENRRSGEAGKRGSGEAGKRGSGETERRRDAEPENG